MKTNMFVVEVSPPEVLLSRLHRRKNRKYERQLYYTNSNCDREGDGGNEALLKAIVVLWE